MSGLDAQFAGLKSATTPDAEDALLIELVFAEPQRETDLFNQLRARLGKGTIELKEVFAAAGQPDRYFFLALPEVNPRGKEAGVFEFARKLADSLGAREVNPCLPDGLTFAHGLNEAEMEALGRRVSQTDPGVDHKGWALHAINAESVWPSTQGKGVKIAQIDTGSSTHVELQGVYDPCRHFNLIETGTPYDAADRFSRDVLLAKPGHGTYGASVMTSRGGLAANDQTTRPGEITGVAPAATIVPIRAIRSVVDLNQTRIPKAIQLAIDSDCDVITMCLGGITHWASVQKAMHEAVEKGLIIVCAAGNIWPSVVFPAAASVDRLCVAVAAVDHKLRPWEWTSRGPAVTVSAPGKNVWAARKKSLADGDTHTDPCNGSTLACSLTSGVAALFVAKHGREKLRASARKAQLTVQELFMRAIVHDLMPPPAWHGAGDLGAGVVDAESALAFDPKKARLAPILAEQKMPPADFTPAAEILRRLVGSRNQLAAMQVDQAVEPFAQELIWRFFIEGASERIDAANLLPDGEKLPNARRQHTAPAEELKALLSERPHLAWAMGY